MLYQNGEYKAYSKKVSSKVNDKVIHKIINVKKEILTAKQRRHHLMAARANLLEWDSLLDNYHSQSAGVATYKFDLSSRLFGAYIHEQMNTRADRQISLKLYKSAKQILFRNYNLYLTFNKKYKRFNKNFKKLANMKTKDIKRKYIKQTHYALELSKYI